MSQPNTVKNIVFKIFEILSSHFGPQNWWPGESELEIMIGAILTQNTNWQNVEKAMKNLKEKTNLEPRLIYQLPLKKLAKIIKPSGFYNIKAKRLKEFLKFFLKEYNGEIEKMRKEDGKILREKLLKIKGIGKETADSILLYALEKPFFVIDNYTKRIFLRHKLFEENKSYDEWQAFFTDNLPKDTKIYNEYHALLVKLAKTYCLKRPLCEKCPLKEIIF
jgi:endonuclease-3 related protein